MERFDHEEKAAFKRAIRWMGLLLALTVLGAGGVARSRERHERPTGPAPPPVGPPAEAEYLLAGESASVAALDSTLADSDLASWIQRTIGDGARTRWEVNDCGEASGSASDSARVLPVCVEARTVLSGGRELYVSVAVGNERDGVTRPAFWDASIVGPDTSVWFSRLSDLERYVDRERPVLGNRRVYLDERHDVHVVTSSNQDVRLTRDGRYRDPKLSPNGESIGMLVTTTLSRQVGEAHEPIEVASELRIYRGGRVVRRFEPGGFIRTWDFAHGGTAVAVYSGALHFAGFYILYDIDSGAWLDRAEDPVTDRSPAWVRSISP